MRAMVSVGMEDIVTVGWIGVVRKWIWDPSRDEEPFLGLPFRLEPLERRLRDRRRFGVLVARVRR